MSLDLFIDVGHVEAHEKLTGRLFYKKVGEDGYIDAGNVRDYADGTVRNLVTRSASSRGARHVDTEIVDINHESFTFTLDENVPAQEQLIRLARENEAVTQESAEAHTATIERAKQGRWHEIGSYNVGEVILSSSGAGLCVEGEDYDLDAENGRVYIIVGGRIADGDDLFFVFNRPGIVFESRTSRRDVLFHCDVLIEEYNQFHKLWLRKLRFQAYLNVTEFPAHTGEFAAYKVKATPSGPVEVLKRPEADTIADPETGANRSSSSSSSESSESDSSRSSYSSPSSSSTENSVSSVNSSSSTLASETSSSSTASSTSASSQSLSSSSTAASQSSYSSESSSSYIGTGP